MIGRVSLAQLAQAIDAVLVGDDRPVTGSVSIDSRSLKAGQLFVAIRGERVDGHAYVEQALQVGAVACVVEKEQHKAYINGPLLVVQSTRQALLQIGRFNRNRFEGLLVGLTGSCGKTSVKEMLATIFSQAGPTLATQGNLNNDLGMPVTLSRLEAQHRYAVIEMGTNAPGEIGLLAQIAQPHISMITNAEKAHLEGLGSVEGVAEEKGAILDSLPVEGTAVLNYDSRFFAQWCARAQRRQAESVSFSLYDNKADVYASDIIHQQEGTAFTLHCLGKSFPVSFSFWGVHQVTNACAATAAALAAGIAPELIVTGLDAAKPYQRRGQRFAGLNGSLIIDESYNANPASTRAAIDMLAVFKNERIFVLGDMGELALEQERAHRDIGAYAKHSGIEKLITHGKSSRLAAEAFGSAAHHFSDKEALINYLCAELSPQTTVLVKGSKFMKMNDIVYRCKVNDSLAGHQGERAKESCIEKSCIENSGRSH